MIGPATILLIASFILEIPQFLATFESLATGKPVDFLAMNSNISVIMEVLAFVSLVLQIITAFFSDFIYMHWTVNKIKHIREMYRNAPEAEYYEALAKKGNPKWFCVFIGLGISLAVYYLFSAFFFI